MIMATRFLLGQYLIHTILVYIIMLLLKEMVQVSGKYALSLSF